MITLDRPELLLSDMLQDKGITQSKACKHMLQNAYKHMLHAPDAADRLNSWLGMRYNRSQITLPKLVLGTAHMEWIGHRGPQCVPPQGAAVFSREMK
jgi:hypothetical protein